MSQEKNKYGGGLWKTSGRGTRFPFWEVSVAGRRRRDLPDAAHPERILRRRALPKRGIFVGAIGRTCKDCVVASVVVSYAGHEKM